MVYIVSSRPDRYLMFIFFVSLDLSFFLGKSVSFLEVSLYSSGEPQSPHSPALPVKCWDRQCAPPCLALSPF